MAGPVTDVQVPQVTLRGIRTSVAIIVVGVLLMAGAFVKVNQTTDDARQIAKDVHAEVQRSAQERCKVTLLSRQGSLDKDIRIFTRLGHQLHASPAQMSEFIAGIREDYADLPLPSDCRK